MIDEIREWFGDGWDERAGEPGRFIRGRAEIAGDIHGDWSRTWDEWIYVADGAVTATAPTIPELAARVRAWHLDQARGIRVEWDDSAFAAAGACDDRARGGWIQVDDGLDLDDREATALRDWLDERLAMRVPGEGE